MIGTVTLLRCLMSYVMQGVKERTKKIIYNKLYRYITYVCM